MNDVATTTRYTPEDLLTMPDGDRYELVDGNLVERPMSFWPCYVGGVLFGFIFVHCRTTKLGWPAPEGTTYQCFPHKPKEVRKADVSFIRLDRLSFAQATEEGHVKIAPDLAVEVVSPNEVTYETDEKVIDFLTAGVRLVWVIHPLTKTVSIHRIDRSVALIGEKDELDGEDVLPGFKCKVADLFVPPTA